MDYRYITLKDETKLYCGYSLGKDGETIIIIHGGPGNGFWDQIPFMEKLSEKYNVIAFDERGVNKSDEVNDDFTSEMLIDDIDEVRSIFNIDRAAFIGHSYGGHLLLRYCIKYNEHVGKAVFLCPSFDFIDSLHNVIGLSKKEFEKRNMNVADLETALSSDDFPQIFQGLVTIPEDIRNLVYGYDNVDEATMSRVEINMPGQEEMMKSVKHQELVFCEGELCKDRTESLKEIKCSSMLIVGDHDPVCSQRQIEKYKKYVKDGRIAILKDSYHFPYLDKITETAKVIGAFMED